MVHPLDRPRPRWLGELMFEVSAGNLTTRDPILELVETLMMNTRDECSSDGAEGVVDRLLAIADHRLGADALGEAALEIIQAAPSSRPPSLRGHPSAAP